MITRLAMAVVLSVALAGVASAATLIQWDNPSPAGGAPNTAAAGLTVGNLLRDGGAVVLDSWQNGNRSGHNWTFSLNVQAGKVVTFTDWSDLWRYDNGADTAMSLNVSGGATASLGSGTLPFAGWGVFAPLNVDTSPDVTLSAGNYTFTLFTQITSGDDGGWSGLRTYTLNGTVADAQAPVPEPATLCLVAIGALGLVIRRTGK